MFKVIVDERGYTPLFTQTSSDPTAQGTASWIVLKASCQLVPSPETPWAASTYQTAAWAEIVKQDKSKNRNVIRANLPRRFNIFFILVIEVLA
jgi:hypothetical protein